jgi:hypothetical protein
LGHNSEDWLDIADAPKNTHIICGHAEKKWIRFGIFYKEMGRWYYSGTSERSQYAQVEGDEPTHWQPMMKPPK